MNKLLRSLLLPVVVVAFSATICLSKTTPTRHPDEDVNSPDVRNRKSMAPGPNILFNGWGLTPAGDQVECGDLALKLVIAPDHKAVIGVCAGYNDVGVNVVSLDAKRNREFIPLKQCFNGLVFRNDGKQFYVSGGDSGILYVFNYADGKAKLAREVKLDTRTQHTFLSGIAVHPSTGMLYVCNEANHEIVVVDPQELSVKEVISVGQHPHTCVFGGDGRHLYVSNWGSRSISIVDTRKAVRVRDMTVGIRPNDMVVSRDGRLFVACAGDNTVHVIPTNSPPPPDPGAGPNRRLWEGAREIISTSLYPQSPEGSTPCALAVSPDDETLFIVNADNNAVMVVDISGELMEEAAKNKEKISLVNGFIPTGWYPSAVAVSPDNKLLLVANGKGLKSRPNSPPLRKNPRKLHTGITFDHPGMTFEGSLSFIAKPDPQQMAVYTEQVRRNSPFHPQHLRKTPTASNSVIPQNVGDPCPIKYVLYIIKENRTYDQVMSDMTDAQGRPIGNGDPNLLMYGEPITPNQHQLARDYVLLDNLYCNSEVSVDGHSWCDAAMATDFNQRSWILSYSKHGKLPGNEEMENPSAGYLWDLCRRHGLSYRNYGEGAQRVPSANRGKWVSDWKDGRDMDLVDNWIADLHMAEKTGELPRFTIMSLGEDHTQGTKPGAYTPEACVASNDLGVGKLVEAASRSRFWNEMAIFIIEDDAQNGPDHVDAHRTFGLVISPYVKRNFVDSTLYTTASMIRTMELILGLPPLTQYDAAATPMFNCFSDKAVSVPYKSVIPEVDLYAKNTDNSPFAMESSRMNFDEVDLAPEDELNRILWYVARPNDPYPTPIHGAIFTSPVE